MTVAEIQQEIIKNNSKEADENISNFLTRKKTLTFDTYTNKWALR